MEANRAKWPRWQLLLVFALAMAVRLIAIKLMPLDECHDPDSYLALGQGLYHDDCYSRARLFHHEASDVAFATAYRPPLYPLLVAGCAVFGRDAMTLLTTAHVLLGAVTAVLMLPLARRWNVSQRAALVTAGLVAIDPILIYQASQAMTETLATFLAVCGLLALTLAGERQSVRWALAAGAVLALAELCRPVFLVWLVWSGWALVLVTPGRRQRRIVGGSFAFAAALVISPWAVRNYCDFGRPIITTTHGGYTLALGNNPLFYRHLAEQGWFAPFDSGAFWNLTARPYAERTAFDEVELDRRFQSAAYEAIRAQRGMFLQACAYRLSRLWGICPLATDANESLKHRLLRYAVAVFYAGEFVLAAWGAWLVGRNWLHAPWLWGLLLVLSVTAVHTVYWTDMRMRTPGSGDRPGGRRRRGCQQTQSRCPRH